MRTLGRSRAAALLEPCVTHGRGVRCDAEPFQRSLAAPYACLNARLGAATAASPEAALGCGTGVFWLLGHVASHEGRIR